MPTNLGKYTLRKELGRGGMGVVYEGVDTLLERPVAIKVVSGDGVDGCSLARLLREARLAARLHHPNTVAVFDAGDHPTGLYIAMELVRGMSAQEALERNGRFGWQEATRIVLEVAQGLAAAHAAELIHRDIKPANILLVDGAEDHQPRAKLADFGLSRTLDRSAPTMEGQLAGTPHYMSPEQIRGETLDERTDIYSLGATYYSLLTGRFPFERDSVIQMLFAHCSAAPPNPRELLPGIPAACAAIVLRAMAKEPRERYASADALMRDLASVPRGGADTLRMLREAVTLPVEPADAETTRSQGPPWERISRSSASTTRHRSKESSKPRLLSIIGSVVIAATILGAVGLRSIVGRASLPVAQSDRLGSPSCEPVPSPAVLDPHAPTIEQPWSEAQNGSLLFNGEIEFMRLARDGGTLAIGLSEGERQTGRLILYDWQRREVVFSHADPRRYASFSCAALPDDRHVVLACSSRVVVIDRQTSASQTLLELDDSSAAALDISADGKRLVVAAMGWSHPGRVELYDLHLNGTSSRIENPRRSSLAHGASIRSVCFSPNGQWIGSADEGGGVCISDALTGELQHAGKLPDRRGGKGEIGYVVAFSPDSQTLAAGGALGLVLFDAATGERRVLPEEHEHGVMSVAWSPAGTHLATGVPDGIRIWNVADGWQVGTTREAHECNVICGLAYANEGKTLISAGFDRRVEFWNIK